MVNTYKANLILKENDKMIIGFVRNNITPAQLEKIRRCGFSIDDVLQEVRISIWRLLEKKYDESRSPARIFIACHLPYSLRNSVSKMIRSVGFTGKIKKRTLQSKLISNTVSIDNSMNNMSSTSYDSEEYVHIPKKYIEQIPADVDLYSDVTYNTVMGAIVKHVNSTQRDIIRFLQSHNFHIVDVYDDSKILDSIANEMTIPKKTFFRHINVILQAIRQFFYSDLIDWSKEKR